MKPMNKISSINTLDVAFPGLYKAGSVAALMAAVIFRRNLDAEWMALRGAGILTSGLSSAPSAIEDWFSLLQHHQLLGLTLLNLFDLVNFSLVGMIILTLFVVLKPFSPSWMVGAAALGFVGVAAYFASNQAFTMLWLSKQYAAASTDAQRAAFLAAGQAVLAIHKNASYAGSGIYLSFLLVCLAGLIISVVMLHSELFSKSTAYFGILAHGSGLTYYIVLIFAPSIVFIPISISAIFLLVWYLLVSRQLWIFGSKIISKQMQHATSGSSSISFQKDTAA
jgi:hypothetical protein